MDIWYKNIYGEIKEFADIEFQKDVWVLGNREDYASSYIEAKSMLFDSFNFEQFIETELKPLDYLSKSFIKEIEKLRNELNRYDGLYKTDEEILNDPKWIKIVERAQKVKSLWEVEIGIPQ